MAKKKDSLGATASTGNPDFSAHLIYSNPSARVNANSNLLSAPASYIWYPDIDIELYLGIYWEVYWKISDMIFIDGSGGYMNVFLTMNSFKISFWMVPFNYSSLAPYSRAVTIYIAKMGKTAPFIVMETEISLRGISLNKIFISSTESIATPAMPTSPTTLSWSESYPLWVAKSKATDNPY
jgi:hypothetical protein